MINKEQLINDINEIIDSNMGYTLSSCINNPELDDLERDIECSLEDIKNEIRELIEKL